MKEEKNGWEKLSENASILSLLHRSLVVSINFDMLMLITEIIGILALSDEGEDFSSMKNESKVNKYILASKLSKYAFRLSHFLDMWIIKII